MYYSFNDDAEFGDIYTDIANYNTQVGDVINKWGNGAWTRLDMPTKVRVQAAFQNIQRNAKSSNAWNAVGQAHQISIQAAEKALKRKLTQNEANELNAHFQRLSRAMPGGGGGFLGLKGPMKWLGNAAATAGRTLTKSVSEGLKGVGGLVGKIPIVGSPLSSVIKFAAAPFAATDAIMHGARIDRALVQQAKDQVSAIKDVAPYAKLVMTSIPGLGSGIGAAIAFGSAAVSGVPLDKAFVEGIKGAIPYGQVGKAVFDYTQKVVSGENVIMSAADVGLNQLPKVARDALVVVQKAAKGENIPKAALEAARKQLPPEAQKALDVGVAIGQGKKLQTAMAEGISKLGPADLQQFANKGASVVASTPLFKSASTLVKQGEQTKGFQVGVAVLNHAGVNEMSVTQFRNKLSNEAKVGFDAAVSARIGKIMSKPAPKTIKGPALAAYYTTKGMAGGGPKQKVALMKTIVANPIAKQGAALAVQEMPKSWWERLLKAIGL